MPSTLSLGTKLQVVALATATGTSFSTNFTVPGMSIFYNSLLHLQRITNNGTISALVADLEISLDGGTTWAKHTIGIDFVATPFKSVNIVPGVLYRINITTFTGGSTPKQDMYALIG